MTVFFMEEGVEKTANRVEADIVSYKNKNQIKFDLIWYHIKTKPQTELYCLKSVLFC